MSKPSNLELACQVFWGETADPDECNLTSTFKDPETAYMEKESFERKFNSLSNEAKEVVRIIFTLPDVCFRNGRIELDELVSRLDRQHGWTKHYVRKYIAEIGKKFGVRHAH